MSQKPNDLKMLISKYENMNIEELKASIDHWEDSTDCSNQLHNLHIARRVLKFKYKVRQQQIELLTKSLTSSSRIGRWISSIKAILNKFVESKN